MRSQNTSKVKNKQFQNTKLNYPFEMKEKFRTLFFVKSSLISLYLALTIPIPFISIDKLKTFSIITFVIGLYLIINITNDYVETCNDKISYNTSFVSRILGRKNWVNMDLTEINLDLGNPEKSLKNLKIITDSFVSGSMDKTRFNIANILPKL